MVASSGITSYYLYRHNLAVTLTPPSHENNEQHFDRCPFGNRHFQMDDDALDRRSPAIIAQFRLRRKQIDCRDVNFGIRNTHWLTTAARSVVLLTRSAVNPRAHSGVSGTERKLDRYSDGGSIATPATSRKTATGDGMLSLLPERRLGKSFNGTRIIFILILTSICHLYHKRATKEKELGCIIPFADLVKFCSSKRWLK